MDIFLAFSHKTELPSICPCAASASAFFSFHPLRYKFSLLQEPNGGGGGAKNRGLLPPVKATDAAAFVVDVVVISEAADIKLLFCSDLSAFSSSALCVLCRRRRDV